MEEVKPIMDCKELVKVSRRDDIDFTLLFS